jgi:hypothetical protein
LVQCFGTGAGYRLLHGAPISKELAKVLTEHRARCRWMGGPVFSHTKTGDALTAGTKLATPPGRLIGVEPSECDATLAAVEKQLAAMKAIVASNA